MDTNITTNQHRGVSWSKTADPDPTKGYTAVVVDGAEVRFHGHRSNAMAWSFIDKTIARRGVRVIGGEICTH